MKVVLPLLLSSLLPLTSPAQIFHVQDMSTTDIIALDRAKTVVLLPGGILEEHGPDRAHRAGNREAAGHASAHLPVDSAR